MEDLILVAGGKNLPIQLIATDQNGDALDLEALGFAGGSAVMRFEQPNTRVFERSNILIDWPSGSFIYDYADGEFDIPGRWRYQVFATNAANTRTLPTDWLEFTVREELVETT